MDDERTELEPNLVAPRTARQVVERFLRVRGLQSLVDDAVLMTSELVANAVVHAATEVSLGVRCDDGVIEIEVGDRARGRVARGDDGRGDDGRGVDGSGTRGRGLLIVEALSERWGKYDTPDGKVVWFQMSASPK